MFYYRLLHESENGTIEVSDGRTKSYDKKSVHDAPKLYVIQENSFACVLCSLPFSFYFIGDKTAADC